MFAFRFHWQQTWQHKFCKDGLMVLARASTMLSSTPQLLQSSLCVHTGPMVSVHVLAFSLKNKCNSTFLLHRTDALQIAPQQRPGSTIVGLCLPVSVMEDPFCKAFLWPFQFKAKIFTLEICQLNTFLFVYFGHCRYLQAVHTFIYRKDICGKRRFPCLSKPFDVGSSMRYMPPSWCLPHVIISKWYPS